MVITLVYQAAIEINGNVVDSLFRNKFNDEFFPKKNWRVYKNVTDKHLRKFFNNVVQVHTTLHEIGKGAG